MTQFYLTAAVFGLFTSIFNVVDGGSLPLLVARTDLLAANARIEFTNAVVEISGPSTAGVLDSALGAPPAMVAPIAALVVSAFSFGPVHLRCVRAVYDSDPAARPAPGAIWNIQTVLRDEKLRTLLVSQIGF